MFVKISCESRRGKAWPTNSLTCRKETVKQGMEQFVKSCDYLQFKSKLMKEFLATTKSASCSDGHGKSNAIKKFSQISQSFNTLLASRWPNAQQLFSQSISLLQEYVVAWQKVHERGMDVVKVLLKSMETAVRIKHWRMVLAYCHLARKCYEESSFENLLPHIQHLKHSTKSLKLGDVCMKWIKIPPQKSKEFKFLAEKTVIVLSSALQTCNFQESTSLYAKWLDYTKNTDSYGPVFGSYLRYVEKFNPSQRLNIMRKYEEALGMNIGKDLPALLGQILHLSRKPAKNYKYQDACLEDLIQKTLNKLKNKPLQLDVCAVVIEAHKENLIVQNQQLWLQPHAPLKDQLCSVSLFLRNGSPEKIDKKYFKLLLQKMQGVMANHSPEPHLNAVLLKLVNLAEPYEKKIVQFLNENEGFDGCSQDCPLIRYQLICETRKRILKFLSSQFRVDKLLATTLCCLIMSECIQMNSQSLQRISSLLHELDEFGECSFRHWSKLLVYISNYLSSEKVMKVFTLLLGCKKIIHSWILNETENDSPQFYKILLVVNEDKVLKKLSMALGKFLIQDLIERKSQFTSCSKYYLIICFFPFFYGLLFECYSSQEKEQMQSWVSQIRQICQENNRTELLRTIFKKLTSQKLKELNQQRLYSIYVSYQELCLHDYFPKQLLIMDFLKFLQHLLQKLALPTIKTIHQLLQSVFGCLKKYLAPLSSWAKSFPILLQILMKKIFIENETPQKEQDLANMNTQFELEQCFFQARKIKRQLTAFEQNSLPFLQKGACVDGYPLYLIEVNQSYLMRTISCCSSLIAVAHHVGSQHLQHFARIKLSLVYYNIGPDYFYFQMSRMIFFGYISSTPEAIKNLREKSHLRGEIGRKIGVNMGWLSSQQSMEQSCFNQITYALNNQRHLHDSKDIIGKLTNLIWMSKQNSKKIQSSLVNLIPFQFCYGISTIETWLLKEEMLDLTPHRLLSMYLSRLLSQVLLHQQKSFFASLLKLAIIYFARSRNIEGVFLTLQCLMYKNIKEINILKVLDCFSLILEQQYPGCLNKEQVNSLFATKRRSLSRVYDLNTVSNKLKSLKDCGKLGNKLIWFFLRYSGNQFNIPLSSLFVRYLSMQDQKYDTEIQKKMRSFFQEPRSPQRILNEMIKLIPASAYHAEILQSELGMFEGLEDSLICEVSVLKLDHNYLYKKMFEFLPPLKLYFPVFRKNVDSSVECYDTYLRLYQESYEYTLKFLKGSLKHPVSILYPLGRKVYNIALYQFLVVTSTDRFQFEDYIKAHESLLQKNKSVILDEKIPLKQWFDRRAQVDRQIRLLANQIDLGIFDRRVRPQELNCLAKEGENCSIGNLIGVEITVPNYFHYMEKLSKNPAMASLVIESFFGEAREDELLLLIHPSFFGFPFQISNSLRKRKVYRVPSPSYLREHHHPSKSNYNSKNIQYAVNVNDNLEDTEKTFNKIKSKYPEWTGVIKRAPTLEEYEEFLRKEIYLFMGHGNGIAHIRDSELYRKKVQCMMIVFGCGSADLCRENNEPHGKIYSHLMNECPCMIGCLWEVTDKDIDKLTVDMFERIRKEKSCDVASLIAKARKTCRLEALTGGAVVAIGLPSQICYK